MRAHPRVRLSVRTYVTDRGKGWGGDQRGGGGDVMTVHQYAL